MKETTALHPCQRIELWFQDEARVGQQGRVAHRWWLSGERPLGLCDRRFTSTYIYAAVCPATGAEFALVMPTVNTKAMNRFLDDFSKSRDPDVHVLLVMDQAGWHGAKELTMPDNITPMPLPPYSPELNPVERVWLYLKEHFLSHRLFENYEAIVTACCQAWNTMTAVNVVPFPRCGRFRIFGGSLISFWKGGDRWMGLEIGPVIRLVV